MEGWWKEGGWVAEEWIDTGEIVDGWRGGGKIVEGWRRDCEGSRVVEA